MCRKILTAIIAVWLLVCHVSYCAEKAQTPTHSVPLIYCTDLFHPHDDPDDHFDIVSIYAIPEFDVRAIVLDQGKKQEAKPGRVPIEQLNQLTGRKIPWVIGLSRKLRSPADKALDEPEKYQNGVGVILKTLKEVTRPVTIITVGSVRDVAAAFNRAPDLLKRKVKMLMIFIGESKEGSGEYNVQLDPHAFVCIMNSGLPVYWAPCFDGGVWKNGGNASFWKAGHGELLRDACPQLINFFIYALERKQEKDHRAFLSQEVSEESKKRLFAGTRNLWCTAIFAHAAGRLFVQRKNSFLTVPPLQVRAEDMIRSPFAFSPVSLTAKDGGKVIYGDAPGSRKVNRFHILNKEKYGEAMTSATRHLIKELSGRIAPAASSPTSEHKIAAPRGYRLVWSDEFETDGRPDPRKWTFERGFVRNRELQWYQRENAFCKNGKLVIEGRRERKPNPLYRKNSSNWKQKRKLIEYTSSCLITRGLQSWQYGRFEIKARIKAQDGLWPAIWFLGVRGEWPSNGEIDLMEYYKGNILANACWGTRTRWKAKWDDFKKPVSSFGDKQWDRKFHVWRMDWDRRTLKLYVDGALLNTIDLAGTVNPTNRGPKNPFHQPHYLLLNLAIGGTAGGDPSRTPFPTRFEIDYVRVFKEEHHD